MVVLASGNHRPAQDVDGYAGSLYSGASARNRQMKLVKVRLPKKSLLPIAWVLLLSAFSVGQTATPPAAQYPQLPSETPDKFQPVTTSFDHEKRDVMIPMRDGVKL